MGRKTAVLIGFCVAVASGAAAFASTETSRFSEVDAVCNKPETDLARYVDAFLAIGWHQVEPADITDQERQDLALVVSLGSIGKKHDFDQSDIAQATALTRRKFDGLIDIAGGHSAVLRHDSNDTQHSFLIVYFEKHQTGSSQLHRIRVNCIIGGSYASEDKWVSKLLEIGRLRDDFTEFDPATENSVSEYVSPRIDDRTLNTGNTLQRVSRIRAERVIGVQLPFDLLFNSAMTFRREG